MYKLYDLIIRSAEKALLLQKEDGSMPSGHNGPYFDSETPVRNTSHWLITFAKAYEITNRIVFLDAVNKAGNYLLSNSSRPNDYTFYHRNSDNKDKCNGLIGQAWSIEALLTAGKVLNKQEYTKLAEKVFLVHFFNEDTSLWSRTEINGRKLSVDTTFNHQLWFASIGSMINNEVVEKQVRLFMNKLTQNMSQYKNGLIKHAVNPKQISKSQIVKNLLMNDIIKHKYIYYKAIGYHSFNLYAFALLKQNVRNHQFWNSKEFEKIVRYSYCKDFQIKLEESKYGYPYNPVGIEMAYALYVFDNDYTEKLQVEWLSKQFEYCYSLDESMLCLNTEDKSTLSARIYEALRLPNLEVTIKEKK